jgi:hypothetical protein
MYDLYPTNETYVGDPQHVAPFCIRASMGEARRWGVALDDEDYRDARDTMVADRLVERPENAVPDARIALQTSMDRRG